MATSTEPVGRSSGPLRGGIALALVGAVMAGAGLLQATSAEVQPSCPEGTVLTARFTMSGTDASFVEPAGSEDVVTIVEAASTSARWTSTRPVAAVVVKAGEGSKDVWSSPAAVSGTVDVDGMAGAPPIDSVQFCSASSVVPSAPAVGFDVVTLGDASLLANESEGPVAIGGDLTFDQYQVAIHSAGSYRLAPGDDRPTALLVRGRLDLGGSAGQVSVQQGWLAVGDRTGVSAKRQNPNQITVNATASGPGDLPRAFGQNSFQSEASALRASTFDFEGAFEDWHRLAAGLASCAPTTHPAGANGPSAPWTGGDAYLYASGTGQQVLQLTAADLAKLTSITFRDGATPTASRPLVVNVLGVPPNWNPPKLNGDSNAIARSVIWNFAGLPEVTITGGGELAGTVLLPAGGLVQRGNGNLVGAVYADSLVHGGGAEIHDNPFTGAVTPCSAPTPPTTTTVLPTSTTTTSTAAPASTTTSSQETTTTSETTTVSEVTTTSESTTTTSAAPTSTSARATTTTADVLTSTVVATSITPDDDARVESTTRSRSVLAFTGSTSLPLTIGGGVLLVAGVTLVLVARGRARAR
jgi:choice-of-anchor A domain-containing protein